MNLSIHSARNAATRGGLLRRAHCIRPFQGLSRPQRAAERCISRKKLPSMRSSTVAEAPTSSTEAEVLDALRRVIDPDFGEDVVACGFVKALKTNQETGVVDVTLELTTPACPVKDMFKRQSQQYIQELPWVREVNITITAQPPKPVGVESGRPGGLKDVVHIIAVSSCKGGVGKSTVAVNLAFTLAQMGAKVGIFDADVYGPSLPTMISPDEPVLAMRAEDRAILPAEYEGVKAVSFGFASQGSAIMRGPMVSGLITQMLTTTEWGAIDYLVVDFPPGTGDIQLTLCQSVAFSAAVIVTTPQKLAFIDVAKGIRMFAKLVVPCVAVVENMSYFEADGKRFFPFGKGSGDRIQADFGLPNLIRLPIVENISAAGDGGRPLVVSDPTCDTSASFMELGASVVREVARMRGRPGPRVVYDAGQHAIIVQPLNGAAFALPPALVRRHDTSARSVDEWTGQRTGALEVADTLAPSSVNPLGNYAVQINWEDGFNQVASLELLMSLKPQAVPLKDVVPVKEVVSSRVGNVQAVAEMLA